MENNKLKKFDYKIGINLTEKQYKFLCAMSIQKNKPKSVIIRELIDEARKRM